MGKWVQQLPFSAAIWGIAVTIACVSSGASAQVPAAQPARIAPSADTAAVERRGITVSGRAEIRAIPDRAYFTATIGYTQGRGTSNIAAAADAIAKALAAAGATNIGTSPSSNGNQLYLGQVGSYIVRGALERPTPARAAAVIAAGDAAAGPYPDIHIQQLQVSPAFSDCGGLDARLQAAALADARAHAERLAKAAGVTLGPVLSIVEGYAQPLCSAEPLQANYAPSAPIDFATGEAIASVSLSATFAIAR